MKETSIAARLFWNLVFDITSTEQKLEFLPLSVGELFDLAVTTPAVENHADCRTFDGLTFAGTKLDKVGSTELSKPESRQKKQSLVPETLPIYIVHFCENSP